MAVLLFVASPAYAYLDPGTGSMILQGLIAGIAMGWFTLKMYWYKVKAFFSKGKDSEPENIEIDEAEKEHS